MSAPLKNVVVIGGAGNVGSLVVKDLLDKKFNITVLSRSESNSTFPAGINVIKGDYTQDFFENAFKGQDAVVIVTSPTAIDQQKPIFEAAVKAGVKRIIPSEFGSDTDDPIGEQKIPFFQVKRGVIDELKKSIESHPQTTWSGVICGPFLDMTLELGALGFDLKQRKGTLYDGGVKKFDTSTLLDVAKTVTGILSNPDKYQNQFVYISSFKISQQDILAALKTASGDSNWDIKEGSARERYNGGQERFAKGDFSGIIDIIFGATFEAGPWGDYSSTRGTSNSDFGIPGESLVEAVKQVWQRTQNSS